MCVRKCDSVQLTLQQQCDQNLIIILHTFYSIIIIYYVHTCIFVGSVNYLSTHFLLPNYYLREGMGDANNKASCLSVLATSKSSQQQSDHLFV